MSYSRYFLCDLQVHTPADHQQRYGNVGTRNPESTFATRLAEAHAAAGVNVFAVTDHNRVDWYPALSEAGKKVGVTVFPGLEFSVNGCHLLAIWERDDSGYRMAERFLATLFPPGVEPLTDTGPLAVTKGQILELAARVTDHHGLVFAPHATMKDNGVLARGVASNSDEIAQSELITAFDVYGERRADVLSNPRSKFGDVPPRWFISGDTRSFEEVGARALYLKLGYEPSLEGLRQAFLSPRTRVRFPRRLESEWKHVRGVRFTDDPNPSWPRLTRLAVSGGFHDHLELEFGPGLTAVIGGKGTGKSALVEIIRYVSGLPDPADPELRENRRRNFAANADATIEFVDLSGEQYGVHRNGGMQPARLTRAGRVVEVPVERRLSVRVFGQRELRSLAEQPDVLRAFIAPLAGTAWVDADRDERATVERLRAGDRSLSELERKIEKLSDSAAELADLSEKLERATAAKAEALLHELDELEAANRDVALARAWPSQVTDEAARAKGLLPIPLVRPLVDVRTRLESALQGLGQVVEAAAASMTAGAATAEATIEAAQLSWSEQYEKARRELDARLADAGIRDPQQYADLQGRVDELRQELSDFPAFETQADAFRQSRGGLLSALGEYRRAKSRALEAATRQLSLRVGPKVRIALEPLGDRGAIRKALDTKLKGQAVRADQIDRLAAGDPVVLVSAIRGSVADLEALGASASTATKLRALSPHALREIEETETPDLPRVEIDLGAGAWREVADVSPGQRATALLALALAGGTDPLVIDQPEDDLDNRYIFQEIVPVLLATCESRQVIVATHNANIPVIGDAEMVVAFDASSDRSQVLASGGLESPSVAAMARQILEGGEEAFRARERRYRTGPG